jgi:hypothetical protein
MVVVDRPIYRQKRIKRRIDSEITYNAVWEQLEYVNNEANIKELLKRSINEDYYALDLQYLKDQRKRLIGNLKNAPKRFIKESEIEMVTPDILASIKQASEYFHAGNQSSPLTKPVFLYYGMVSLAKSLIQSTYMLDKFPQGHGLKVLDDETPTVTILKSGEFSIFHDCYIGDPYVYSSNDLEISLKELLSVIPGIAMEWDIAYNGLPEHPTNGIPEHSPKYSRLTSTPNFEPYKKCLSSSKKDMDVYFGTDEGILSLPDKSPFIHVIDAYFMAMFILCHMARYRPLKWMDMLNNSQNTNSYLINIFLRRSELDFPILIFNEMTAIKHYFSTFPRWG